MSRFPAAMQPALFAILTTGFASFMVSGIATLRALGPAPGFLANWIGGWLWSWLSLPSAPWPSSLSPMPVSSEPSTPSSPSTDTPPMWARSTTWLVTRTL